MVLVLPLRLVPDGDAWGQLLRKKELLCGIPQGAILSLMLFNIYMKLLGDIIWRHGAGCYQYADDTQIYFSMPPTTVSAKDSVSPLNECLEALMGWMRKNKTEAESRQDGGAYCQRLQPGFGGVSTSSGWGYTPPERLCLQLGDASASVAPNDSPDRCDSKECLLSASADTPAAPLPRVGRPKDGSAHAGNLEA